MCQFKSGIILKDRVFLPDYDSHSDMMEELKIKDTRQNAERLFVRAELIPAGADPFSPIDSWKYRVDQDILPDWYVAEVDEARMREAVKEWAKERILIGQEIKEIHSGSGYYIKDCKIGTVFGSAEIRYVCGSAKIVDVSGSAKICSVYESAKIGSVYGSANIGYVFGSAKIGRVFGSAEIVRVYGSAKIGSVYGSAKIRYVCGSAKIGDVCGSAKIGDVCGSAEIGEVYGSAKIVDVSGSAKIRYVCGSAKIGDVSGSAKIDYVDGYSVVCGEIKHIGKIKDLAVVIDYDGKKIYHAGNMECEVVKK